MIYAPHKHHNCCTWWPMAPVAVWCSNVLVSCVWQDMANVTESQCSFYNRKALAYWFNKSPYCGMSMSHKETESLIPCFTHVVCSGATIHSHIMYIPQGKSVHWREVTLQMDTMVPSLLGGCWMWWNDPQEYCHQYTTWLQEHRWVAGMSGHLTCQRSVSDPQ